MLKAKDLRVKSLEELEAILNDARKELFFLLNKAKLEKTPIVSAKYNRLRKEIARMLTVIRETQLATA